MKQYKIGFIGVGNMAQAIIRGMLKSSLFQEKNIFLFDKYIDVAQIFCNSNMNILSNISEIPQYCDIIILAIKPQNYKEVIQSIKNYVSPEQVFVSIAAGISTSYIKKNLGVDSPVVRVMPNTPLLLGKGSTAICKDNIVSEQTFLLVKQIFESSSFVEIIPENKMNEVIAINGSSPAYVYMLTQAALEYANMINLDQKTALNLFCKSIIGSAYMLMESGFDSSKLLDMVCSKGGTTIEAVNSLKQNNFSSSIINAMKSCTKRAYELSDN